MAYWFHRNPLKATTPLTFELRGVSTNEKTRKIFSDLRQHRNKLLEYLTDPNHDAHSIETTINDYAALLQGLYMPFGDEPENKLRRIIKFRWTDSLLGNATREAEDAVFEHVSMLINVALWYTKHAAKIAAKEEPNMEEAKEVHKCLRTASGIFTYVKTELVPKLAESVDSAVDTDSRILDAYINQCTAEAQEVTLARAMELKHSASLVAALAYETSQIYRRADDALASLDAKTVGKWKKYCALKADFYMSYAYSFHGEALLAEDKCGEAIRCLQESVKLYDQASRLAQEYGTQKGPGTSARPLNHIFFRRLRPIVKRTLEKCERENGLIYHHKVPFDPPQLDLKPTYGLVSPVEFQPVPLSPLWSIDVYKKMDTKTAVKPDPREKEKKPEKEQTLPPVKEKEYPMSDKDPNTSSGCVIS
ncbi:BRO1 domain-containing protein BROX-like [Liolophura sinensis]|uniref:BRO1 domain-containing protein BROX-like n=1 Tax=Liolophura sinensis TaxID=3198878 RepID=UPI00315903B4